LCLFCVYPFLCLLVSVHMCILLFSLFDLSFAAFPSVLCYCWLGLLICKNRLPYNLYCVGGDVKHCLIQSNSIYRELGIVHVLRGQETIAGVMRENNQRYSPYVQQEYTYSTESPWRRGSVCELR